MIPLLNQRIMLTKMNFEVFVVDLLHMQRSHPDWNEPEDERLALNGQPRAPALRKRGAARYDPSQRPNDMNEKRAFLNFVPGFRRGTIQDRRDINYHRLASRHVRVRMMVASAIGSGDPVQTGLVVEVEQSRSLLYGTDPVRYPGD